MVYRIQIESKGRKDKKKGGGGGGSQGERMINDKRLTWTVTFRPIAAAYPT